MKRIKFIFLTFFAIFMIVSTQAQYKKTIKELDRYFGQALIDWEVPGMAVAIVKDDSVIFKKGYGVLEIGKNKEVDEFTVFPIASNTKAFTAAALGILVEEGKIKWDDKVRDYLPWFELYDPYVSNNMTIRDLLCHRSGLVTFSGDLLWYGTTYDREEVVRRAKHLEPGYGFREHYGYSNIMFIAAGLIIEEVSGKTWDEVMEETFFQPLGMERSITSTNDLENMKNVATPHTDYQDEIIPIPYLNWDNIAPAGSIISCVDDVAQWLRLNINKGIYQNDTILSRLTCHEMWSPQTVQRVSMWSENNFPTLFKSYGLGWALMDYHGKKVVSHGGGYDGMISQTAFVPEEGLGVVILTNKNSWLIMPILYKTLDAFLSEQDKDWSAFYLDFWKNRKEREKTRAVKLEENRIKNTTPSLPLEKYTGIYHDEMYGDADVTLKDGQLFVSLVPAPQFIGDLTHYHLDVFEIELKAFPSLPKGLVNFTLNSKGEVAKMVIDIPNPDFDFTEMEFVKQ